jgi:hypothetical protein
MRSIVVYTKATKAFSGLTVLLFVQGPALCRHIAVIVVR